MSTPKGYTEIEVPAETLKRLPPCTWSKCYMKGDIKIIISLEVADGFHVSASCPGRKLTFDEMRTIQGELIPDDIKMDIGSMGGSPVTHMWEVK